MNKQLLIQHIQSHSQPMEPLPTGEAIKVGLKPGIRAVVFDVYGTLFMSGSGDISLAQDADRSGSLVTALETGGFTVITPDAVWSDTFMATLEQFRDTRAAEGVAYPEIRIEEVWSAFIEKARDAGWLKGQGDVELAIVDHECRVNPCWPMPGLNDVLTRLSGLGLPLGIISNAQFYTPLLFPALLEKPLLSDNFIQDFCVWSFEQRMGKPSVDLYRLLKDRLAASHILPEEVLYVGNDLRNDIWPARELGFRTVLFAGDARSLRWREDDPACEGIRPDYIITALPQLFAILG